MRPRTALSIGLAVLAAISNAVSNVLQRTADRREPHRLELHFGLLWDLLHKPIWLAGIAASLCSFALVAAALRNGPLALVQPFVVLELPLTLLIAGTAFRVRLHAREWGAMALLTAGLAAFVGFLAPRESAPRAPVGDWLVGLGLTVAVVGALVLVAQGTRGGRRAALLGAAAGILFGLTAALIKGMTWQFPGGVVAVLTAWQTYGVFVVGGLAFLLFQTALTAGNLVAAQPGVSLLDPCCAMLWAIFAFHEPIAGGLRVLLAIAGGILLGVGAFLLSRSPLLGARSTPSAGADGGR